MKWFSKSPLSLLTPLTNPEQSTSRVRMLNCLQDLADTRGDHGRVGNPRLLGRSEESHNQPSQSNAMNTPCKRCWRVPCHICRSRGRSPFLLPDNCKRQLQIQDPEPTREQKFGHQGWAWNWDSVLKLCLRNPGPSVSAWAVTDALDAAVVPKLGGERHAK